MFSYRDLQAISLLGRLDKTSDSHKEQQLLGALYNTPSQLSIKGLLERTRSPRLVTRLEAIRALEKLESISQDAESALINDIIHHPFTTAYISARILGNQGCVSSIPVLRELAASTDYMLAGEAMIALAKLRDFAFRPQIERIILDTQNPRLQIMGAEALGMYALPDSLHTLTNILKSTDLPPYLRDEIILSMSTIINTEDRFYRILVRYTAEPSLATALALDEAESAVEFYKSNTGRIGRKKKNERPLLASQADSFQAAVVSLEHDKDGSHLSRWILGLPGFAFTADPAFETAKSIFFKIIMEEEMNSQKCLRLLIVHWAARQLRNWTKRLRK
jgi:HEAT repeat protein